MTFLALTVLASTHWAFRWCWRFLHRRCSVSPRSVLHLFGHNIVALCDYCPHVYKCMYMYFLPRMYSSHSFPVLTNLYLHVLILYITVYLNHHWSGRDWAVGLSQLTTLDSCITMQSDYLCAQKWMDRNLGCSSWKLRLSLVLIAMLYPPHLKLVLYM